MIWVTRERPIIDRIACPWLIVRFIDPKAQFLFAPETEVLRLADNAGGTAFDTKGARLSHDGPLCTFDLLIREHGLGSDTALMALAAIVRAADTDTLEAAPQAAGLLALSFGLRRRHARDQELIEHGIAMYDALYLWCQHDRGATHDWPAGAQAGKRVARDDR